MITDELAATAVNVIDGSRRIREVIQMEFPVLEHCECFLETGVH